MAGTYDRKQWRSYYKSASAPWRPEDELPSPSDQFSHRVVPWTGPVPTEYGPCNFERTLVWMQAVVKAQELGCTLRVVPGHEDLWPKQRRRGRPPRR